MVRSRSGGGARPVGDGLPPLFIQKAAEQRQADGVKRGLHRRKCGNAFVDLSFAKDLSNLAITQIIAIGLALAGVNFTGHTHPTAVNMITCSIGFEEAFSGRLFPDEIVVCCPAPVLVPYIDPGLPLAREIRRRINAYIEGRGELPRVILMQNHGMIALGSTAKQAANITATMVKTARILVGSYAMGGPHFMSEAAVRRIHTRPDERYRQRLLR